MPEGPAEAEIAAILTRLREEVRGRPASIVATSNGGGLPIRLTARQEAERLWPVTAERPLQLRPGPLGKALNPLKAVLRKLMRWYVEPALADQRQFNSTVLELVDDLAERTSAHLARLGTALDTAPPEPGPYAEDLRGLQPVLVSPERAHLEAAADLGAIVATGPVDLELAASRLRPGGLLVAERDGDARAAAEEARTAGFRRVDVRFGEHGFALLARR
jgi:hypothetical protein